MAPFDNPPTSSLSTKISPLIDGQLPDYVRDENPLFSRFIQYYYEYLEAAELLVDAQVRVLIGRYVLSTNLVSELHDLQARNVAILTVCDFNSLRRRKITQL